MNYSTKHKSISRFLSMVLAIAMVLTSSAFQAVEAEASIRNNIVSNEEVVVENEAVATEEVSEAVVEEVNEENAGKEEEPEVVTYAATGAEKIDVWDFHFTELDPEKFNNLLTMEDATKVFDGKAYVGDYTDVATHAALPLGKDLYLNELKNASQDAGLRWYNSNMPNKGNDDLPGTADFTDIYGFTGDTYLGCIYLNSNDAAAGTTPTGRWLELRNCKEGDIVTVEDRVNGNGTDAYFWAVDADGNFTGMPQHRGDLVKGTGNPEESTFYVPEDGTYRYVETDKLYTCRVYREHTADVAVTPVLATGSDSYTDKVVFVNQKTGKEYSVAVGETVTLKAGYKYTVKPENTSFISDVTEIELAKDAEPTLSQDIKFISVETVNVKGRFTISGNELKNLAEKANFSFVSDKPYSPKITFVKSGDDYTGEFTAEFEKNAKYTVSVSDKTIDGKLQRAANDYEIKNNPTPAYSADTEDCVIEIAKKATVSVNIIPQTVAGVPLAFAEADTLTFTNVGKPGAKGGNAEDEGYVYTFKGTDEISLRPGDYKLKVSSSNGWAQQLTSDVIVDKTPVSKVVKFVAELPTSWNFKTDADWKGVTDGSFKGLEIAGALTPHGYGSTTGNATIKVPMASAGEISIKVGYAWNLVMPEGSVFVSNNPTDGKGGVDPAFSVDKLTYTQTAGDTPYKYDVVTYSVTPVDGYVTVKLPGTTYLESIEVSTKKEMVTSWDFSSDDFIAAAGTSGIYNASYKGIEVTGQLKYHSAKYGSQSKSVTLKIPMASAGQIKIGVGYTWDLVMPADAVLVDPADFPVQQTTATGEPVATYNVTPVDGYVTIGAGSATTTYIKTIELVGVVDPEKAYIPELTVNKGVAESNTNYHTIQAAVDKATEMQRTDDQRVTILITPGDYEEQLRINTPNITLKNASATPSIATKNKGVDIDENAVRITWYYGHGYNYYSMTTHHRYDPEVLAVNTENGYPSFVNQGSGSTDNSYWNASVSVMDKGSGFAAEGIIFENSFNQYVSKESVKDTLVKKSDAKEETTAKRADMKTPGDTRVQQKGYVERAAAFAFYNNVNNVYFDNCKFIGRQDVLYGGRPATAAFNKCEILGGTDYIMGGFTGIFNECILKMNTDDNTDSGVKNDVSYLTAPQQTNTRGYLFYNCTVTSAEPGVENGAQYKSKPGYWGRAWEGSTSEALFVNTIIDSTDAHWIEAGKGESIISPVGWMNGLSSGSEYCAEYNTMDVVDNSASRAESPAVNGGVLELKDGKLMNKDKEVTPEAYLGDWKPFGEDFKLELTAKERTEAPTISENVLYMDPEEDAAPYVKTDEEGKPYYTEALKVFINTPAGAKVYYTTDGSIPTEESDLYDPATGAIINPVKGRKATIKLTAVAIADGKLTSYPATASYTIVDNSLIKKEDVIDLSDGLKEGVVYGNSDTVSFVIGNTAAGLGWPASAASKEIAGIQYTCTVQGKVNPKDNADETKGSGPNGANIMLSGAYIEVTAKEAGTLTLVTSSAAKTYYFTEIDKVAGTAKTLSTGSAVPDGVMSFNLEKGKMYQFALNGSKLKLYGITLQYMMEPAFYEKTVKLDQETQFTADKKGLKPGVNYGMDGFVDLYVGSNEVYTTDTDANKTKQEFKYATGSITVDGVTYDKGSVQAVDNARIDSSTAANPANLGKEVAEWGGYFELTVHKDSNIEFVYGAASGKKGYIVEIDPVTRKAVQQADGKYYILEKDCSSAGTIKVEGKAGKTYQVYLQGSKIKVFNIYISSGDKMPKKWRAVDAPVIKGITLSEDRNDYKVAVDGIVGDQGGDVLKCFMVNKDTEEVVEKMSKAKGADATFTFTPAKSGNYEFYASLERDGEDAKTSATVDPTAFELAEMFDLQYTVPTINALTNKYDAKTNDARVEVSYDTVKEADKYTITVTNVSGNIIKKEDIEGSKATGVYLVKELPISESDEDIYTFKLEAISNKGEERVPRTSSTKTTKIEALNVTTWASTTYGTSTTDPATRSENGSKELSHYKNGELESVHVWSTGGKGKIVPASTDGLTFHYTKVDKNQNFTLGGDVYVNNWVYSNGQDGFGLMVSDTIYKYDKLDSARWNNSYQLLCSLIEYRYNEQYGILTDAATDFKFNTRLGVLYRAKEGVTPADLPKISAGTIAAPEAWNYYGNALEASVGEVMAPKLREAGRDPKDTYDNNVIANRNGAGLANADRLLADFRMEIQRVDNAYVLRYVDISYAEDIELGGQKYANPYVITADGKKLPKYDSTSLKSGFVVAKNEGKLIPVIKKEDGSVEELTKEVDGKLVIDEARLGEATTGKFGRKVFIDDDRQTLTKLDAKNVFVGFIAARNGDMTASNILFEAPDDNTTSNYGYSYSSVAADVEYVAPSYQTTTDTTRFANSDISTVGFSANANGKLSIYDKNGNTLVAGADVKAGQTAYVSPKVQLGENKLTWSFTPASNYNPGENKEFLDYSTQKGEFTVYRATVEGEGAGTVSGNVIYVKQSPTGAENAQNAIDYATKFATGKGKGTKADPVDIFTAVSFATPGQTIKMAGGTYNMTEALEVPKFHRGTKTNMIKMMTDDTSATRAVLDFKNIEVAADAFVIWSHYWYFQGFDVTNSQGEKKGIKIGGSYNTLDNLRAYNNSNSGFDNSRQGAKETREEWPSYNLYLNCSSFANSDVKSEDGDGFAMKITCGKGNRCVGCIAAFNGDDGWDLYAKSETGCIEPVTVENSVAFANAYLISERVTEDGKDIWKFTGTAKKGPGNGNGFKMGGESLSGYHVLKNSVAFGNKADGITTNSCPDLQVSNVTTYGNEGANLSLYTSKSALSTDFLLKGLISLNGGNDSIAGQNKQSVEKLFNGTNYYNNVSVKTNVGAKYSGTTGTINGDVLGNSDLKNTDYKKVINDFVATTVAPNFLSTTDCEIGITRDENHNIRLGANGDLFKLADTVNAKKATEIAKAAGLENAGGADTISSYAVNDVIEKVYEATIIADTVATLKGVNVEAIDKDLVGAKWLYEDTALAPFAGSKATFIAVDAKGIEREVVLDLISVTGVQFVDEDGNVVDAKTIPVIVKDSPKTFEVRPVYTPASADIADVNSEVAPVAAITINVKETTKLGVKIDPATINSFDDYSVEISAADSASGTAKLKADMVFTYNSYKGKSVNVKKSATMSFISRTVEAEMFNNVKITKETCDAKTVVRCDGNTTVDSDNRLYKLNIGEEFQLLKDETLIDGKALTVKPVDASVVKFRAADSTFVAAKAGTTTVAVSDKKDKSAVQYIDVQVIDQPFTTNVASLTLDISKEEGPEFQIVDIYDTIEAGTTVSVNVLTVDGSTEEAKKYTTTNAGVGLNFRLNAADNANTKRQQFVFEVVNAKTGASIGKTDATAVFVIKTTPKVKVKITKPINWFYTGDEANGELQITSPNATIESVTMVPGNKYIKEITPSATKKNTYDVKIKDSYNGEQIPVVKVNVDFTNYKEGSVAAKYGIYDLTFKPKFEAPKVELEMANKTVYKTLKQDDISFKLYNKNAGVYVTESAAEVAFFKKGVNKVGNLLDGLAETDTKANKMLGLINSNLSDEDYESFDVDTSSVSVVSTMKGNVWTIHTDEMDLTTPAANTKGVEPVAIAANTAKNGKFNAYVKLPNWRVGVKVSNSLTVDNKTEAAKIKLLTSNNLLLASNKGIAGNEVARADLKFGSGKKEMISDFDNGDIVIAKAEAKSRNALVPGEDIFFDVEKDADNGKFVLTAKLNGEASIPNKQTCQYNITFSVNDKELKPITVKVDIKPVTITTTSLYQVDILDRKAASDTSKFILVPNFNGLNYESITDVSLKAVRGASSDACSMFDAEYDAESGRMFIYGKEDVDLIPGAKYAVYPSFKVTFENGSEAYVTATKPVNVVVKSNTVFYGTLPTAELKLSDTRNEAVVEVIPMNPGYTLTDLSLVNFKDNFEVTYDFDEISMKGTGALHIKIKDLNGLKSGQKVTLQLRPTYVGMPSKGKVNDVKLNVMLSK